MLSQPLLPVNSGGHMTLTGYHMLSAHKFEYSCGIIFSHEEDHDEGK